MTDHAQYAELLALYAVGALDAKEASDLETHLRSCAECQSELAALRGDAALLALSVVGSAPPQRVRQRVMAAIENEPRKQPISQRFVLGTLRPRSLSFAPIAAALLLAIFSLMLWRLDARLQRRLEQAQAELQQTREKLQKTEGLVALLQSPDSMHLTLVSVKEHPLPQVHTVYSSKMGRLFLMAGHLEPLPKDKAYELWLLPMNGSAPRPCGTFWPDAKGEAMMYHSMPETGIEAKGFAITVEPDSGSSAPTSPIQMMSPG